MHKRSRQGFAICTSRAIELLGSRIAQLARIVLFQHMEDTLPRESTWAPVITDHRPECEP